MRIFALDTRPDEALARSLARFEQQFTYPLGETQRFHVSHGDDYPKFFRALGRARCFFAEREGAIIGSLAVVVRKITLPNGTDRDAVYIADLKIAPHARGGRTLLRLATEAAAWVGESAPLHFGVVMDGTAVTPDRYTGRAGLPFFRAVAKTVVLRLSTLGPRHDPAVKDTDSQSATACYRKLSAGRYATPGGTSAERSSVAPVWLTNNDGSACGCLEDTQRAKRLILEDGTEMISAHLSCFAYREVRAGASLIRAALARARELGFPAMFTAVTATEAKSFGGIRAAIAPATVFGDGIARNREWNVNTAEI